MTKVYVITSVVQFNEYFPLLKKDAQSQGKPKIYCVGFDTEYICKANHKQYFTQGNPNWVIDKSCTNVVCTIQLASANICLVIHLVQLGLPWPNKLTKLVTSPSWLKVGIGIDLDLLYLSQNYQLGHCSGGLDIRHLALFANLPNQKLDYLYSQITGNIHNKSKSGHDWAKTLTETQLTYAAKDAIMSYILFCKVIQPTIQFMKENTSTINDIELEMQSTTVSCTSTTQLQENTPKRVNNYVGRLQEYAQKRNLKLPVYRQVTISNYRQQVTCTFLDKEITTYGEKMKETKQDAAQYMLMFLE